ncbi:MAG: metal-dependent phosphohydrolase [Desulfobacterales bacterium RIFOXYA12_FULL_46_15]|nr:MAG: metal-dependent phosphohydrolase [Desulfobacterales bacterium RIFOXYA12_FULL_46_15]
MNILSRTDCFKLIKTMDMMDHIIDHSVMVTNVTFFLCLQLKKKIPKINTELATSAALLHDITKTRSFHTKENHPETGGSLLTDMGYPEVGSIIRQHVILDSYISDSPVSEQEIVNYSDKRVLHDRVVSLNERLEYIRLRYGKTIEFQNRVRIMVQNTLNLENKIFLHLDIKPDELSSNVTNEIKRIDYP